MIRTTKYFEVFEKKGVKRFCQSVDAILKEISVAKSIA